jgi:hypothetical protein
MTDLTTPGARRLFPVDPPATSRLEIVGRDGTVLVRTGDLAAATIAAAAVAARQHAPAWIIAPDRWAIRLARTDGGWHCETCGPCAVPIDAIRRVLTHIPPQEQP